MSAANPLLPLFLLFPITAVSDLMPHPVTKSNKFCTPGGCLWIVLGRTFFFNTGAAKDALRPVPLLGLT